AAIGCSAPSWSGSGEAIQRARAKSENVSSSERRPPVPSPSRVRVVTPSWRARRRVRIGRIAIDALRLSEAVDAVEDLVTAGEGGMVFTPNVDHVVQAEENPLLREAYAA